VDLREAMRVGSDRIQNDQDAGMEVPKINGSDLSNSLQNYIGGISEIKR